jgi:hypothetical protein
LEAIEYVLQLQIRSCRDIDLDNRLQACYLGDIILEGKTTHLDQGLLSKVQQSCAILKYANARAFIRATYLDDNASAQSKSTVQNSYVEKLWGKIFGAFDSPPIRKAYRTARIGSKEWIRYNELERILVCGFIERGSLIDISEELMGSVDCTSEEQYRSSPSDYAGRGPSSFDEEDSPMNARRDPPREMLTSSSKSKDVKESFEVDNLSRKILEIEALSSKQFAFPPVRNDNYSTTRAIMASCQNEEREDQREKEEEEEMRPLGEGDEYDQEIFMSSQRKDEVLAKSVNVGESQSVAEVSGSRRKPPRGRQRTVSSASSDENPLRSPAPIMNSCKNVNIGINNTTSSSSNAGSKPISSMSSLEAKLLELEAMMKSGGAPLIATASISAVTSRRQSLSGAGDAISSAPPSRRPSITLADISCEKIEAASSNSITISNKLMGELTQPSPPKYETVVPVAVQGTPPMKPVISQVSERGTVTQSITLASTPILIQQDHTIPENKRTKTEAIFNDSSDNKQVIGNPSVISPRYKDAESISNIPIVKERFVTGETYSQMSSKSASIVSPVPSSPSPQNQSALSNVNMKEDLEELPKENVFNKWKNMSKQQPLSPQTIPKGSLAQAKFQGNTLLKPLTTKEHSISSFTDEITSTSKPTEEDQHKPTEEDQKIMSPIVASPAISPSAPFTLVIPVSNISSLDKPEENDSFSTPVHKNYNETSPSPDKSGDSETNLFSSMSKGNLQESNKNGREVLQSSTPISESTNKSNFSTSAKGTVTTPARGGQTLNVSNREASVWDWSVIIGQDANNVTELIAIYSGIRNVSLLQLPHHFQFLRTCNLSNNEISGKIETRDFPTSLTSLDLSHNHLVDINGLAACASLTRLNVSYNAIKTLFGVPAKLTELDISHNKIVAVASIRSLMLSKKLTELTIAGNPVMDSIANPRIYLTSFLNSLQVLDGRRLIPEKRKAPEVYHPISSIGYYPGNIAFANKPAMHLSPPRIVKSPSPTRVTHAQQQKKIEQLLAEKKKIEQVERQDKSKKTIKKLPFVEIDKIVNRLAESRHPPKKEDPSVATSNAKSHSSKFVLAGGRVKSVLDRAGTVSSSVDSSSSVSHSGISSGRKSRDSSVGRRGSMPISIQVGPWLATKQEQLAVVADIFRIPFGFQSEDIVDTEALEAFEACVEEAKSYLDIPIFVRKAIKNDLIDQELLRSVDEVMTQMDKSIALLQQIQTVALLATDASVQYSRALQIMMHSSGGQYVQETVLRAHNCVYQVVQSSNEANTKRREVLSPSSLSTPALTQSIVPKSTNASGDLTRNAEFQQKTEGNEEFSHKFRDVPQSQTIVFPEISHDIETKRSVSQESQSAFDPSPFMDRMRQRLVRKYIPSEFLAASTPAVVSAMTEEDKSSKHVEEEPVSDDSLHEAEKLRADKEEKEATNLLSLKPTRSIMSNQDPSSAQEVSPFTQSSIIRTATISPTPDIMEPTSPVRTLSPKSYSPFSAPESQQDRKPIVPIPTVHHLQSVRSMRLQNPKQIETSMSSTPPNVIEHETTAVDSLQFHPPKEMVKQPISSNNSNSSKVATEDKIKQFEMNDVEITSEESNADREETPSISTESKVIKNATSIANTQPEVVPATAIAIDLAARDSTRSTQNKVIFPEDQSDYVLQKLELDRIEQESKKVPTPAAAVADNSATDPIAVHPTATAVIVPPQPPINKTVKEESNPIESVIQPILDTPVPINTVISVEYNSSHASTPNPTSALPSTSASTSVPDPTSAPIMSPVLNQASTSTLVDAANAAPSSASTSTSIPKSIPGTVPASSPAVTTTGASTPARSFAERLASMRAKEQEQLQKQQLQQQQQEQLKQQRLVATKSFTSKKFTSFSFSEPASSAETLTPSSNAYLTSYSTSLPTGEAIGLAEDYQYTEVVEDEGVVDEDDAEGAHYARTMLPPVSQQALLYGTQPISYTSYYHQNSNAYNSYPYQESGQSESRNSYSDGIEDAGDTFPTNSTSMYSPAIPATDIDMGYNNSVNVASVDLPASTISFATAARVVSARDRLRARLAKNKSDKNLQQQAVDSYEDT